MGSVQNVERFAGDTYPERASLSVNGNPLPLDGKTVTMIVYADSEISITGDVVDEAGGRVEFDMSNVATLPAKRYTFEIKVDDTNYITTFIRAILEIK